MATWRDFLDCDDGIRSVKVNGEDLPEVLTRLLRATKRWLRLSRTALTKEPTW